MKASNFHKGPTGIAMVIVLVVLVLVFGLCVALLARVSKERTSSFGNYSVANVRLLANTAIQLVQGQIDAATTQGNAITWSSQPGLIRTYDNTGAEIKCYKLYSSSQMQVTGTLVPSTEETALANANWSANPASYTDLNIPVNVDATGKYFYPIVDPTLIGTSSVPQGFSISGAPTGTYEGISNQAPTPVQWLYQLRDGTLVAPSGGSGNTATVPGAGPGNPIVGRIAFWTDDETCKVNLNTASEGTYWDVPRANTQQELNLANYQPAQNEFQAFPGHPATTSLSAVLTGGVYDPSNSTYSASAIFSLVPRLVYGGSQGGTVAASTGITLDTDRLYPNVEELLFAQPTSSTPPRVPNDLTDVTAGLLEQKAFFLTTCSRSPELNLFNLPKIACWPISSTNDTNHRTAYDDLIAFCSQCGKDTSGNPLPYYFQRANSHDPTSDYVNIARNQALYSYLQTLLSRPVPGFGGYLSSKYGTDTNQILTEIFDYIRCTDLWDGNLPFSAATDVNGSKYSGGQFTEGQKNNSPTVTPTFYPGHGQVVPIQIGSTMGFGRYITISEVGTEFICTADGTDVTGISSTTGSFTAPPSNNADGAIVITGSGTYTGTSTPPCPANLTLDQDGYLAPASSVGTISNGTLTLPANYATQFASSSSKQIRIEAATMLEEFCPMLGFSSIYPDIEITIDGLQNWTVEGNGSGSPGPVNLGFPSASAQTPTNAGLYIQREMLSGYATWGGPMGCRQILANHGIRARGRMPADPQFNGTSDSSQNDGILDRQYPFVSNPVTITVSSTNPQMTLHSGSSPLTIKIIDRLTGKTVQTNTVTFPDQVNIPAPSLSPPGGDNTTYNTGTTTSNFLDSVQYWTFQSGGATGTTTPSTGRCNSVYQGSFYFFVKDHDVLRSVVPADSSGTHSWDFRLLAANPVIPTTSGDQFVAHPSDTSTTTLVSSFYEGTSSTGPDRGIATGKLDNSLGTYPSNIQPDLPYPITTMVGDWDTGITYQGPGPYLNKPDEGNFKEPPDPVRPPYFGSANPGSGYFNSIFTSPNRVMPSPVMFGSLPTGVKRDQGWETLLFRRQPTHPNYVDAFASSVGASPKGAGGFANAPDYLLLDNFWMPVVQPYAISEPFSTAGKINMNEQIIPFTYITRNTGLYAVLKNEKILAIPNGDLSANGGYKNLVAAGTSPLSGRQYHQSVDVANTLQQFQYRFSNADGTGLYAFRTPSEICDMHIIPQSPNPAISFTDKASLDTTMANYWANNALTGDDARERPYATIYPRLCTKSNDYRVFFRAQTLKQVAGTDSGSWVEGTDMITADYRGSAVIERYVDPNNSSIPDYGSNPDATPNLENFYHWHVRSFQQFAPSAHH